MAELILATKLYVPPPRPSVVSRPRLIERLNEGMERKLILISASAGFGKTTLLSAWIADCGRPVAWLSLDEADSDLSRFLTYVIAALQTVQPILGKNLLTALLTPQPPSVESLLTSLLNEISALPNDLILVLDDYHLLDSKSVDEALTFLVERLPPQMHLVIATREDPSLPLARLRVRGQLTELRAADLRFTPVEAAEFLNRTMGLNPSDEDVAALETRTEGWIAGLQLAALSMQGDKDTAGFIKAFTGSNRFVLDYLIEEVLQRQPELVRNFLLQTSILDKLCGALCDAVTGQADGRGMLETLERDNLFIVPLDDKRHWYRYHHLFAEVLHAHLMAEQPDQVTVLHQRASEWHEHNGSAADAIHHALAAKDFERAATLIELAVPEMRRNRQGATVTELGWLKALPDEMIRLRPVLSVDYAYALVGGGELEGVEAWLQNAEQWLDTMSDIREQPESPAAGTRPERSRRVVVVDEEEFRRLPGMIALLRAAQALGRGDLPETVKNARRVLDLAPRDAHLMLGGAASQLGLAAWAGGDLETARRTTVEGMAHLRLAGYHSAVIGCAITLADVQITQGRLHEAMTTYEQALQWATEPGAPALAVRGAADMYVGISNLHYEHNDLKTATQCLLTSQSLGELAGMPQNPYRWCAAMARIREAQSDLDGALQLLDQAERVYDANFSPNVRPLATRKTRVWIKQGRLGEVLNWAREQGLSVENELSYLHEFDHITLVRALLACYQSDHADRSIQDAMGLLERLLKAAEEGGRKGSAIEILILQALAHHTQDDLPAALEPLQKALTLAEPQGYIRMFVDEGEVMRLLILDFRLWVKEQSHPQEYKLPGYLERLLAAFTQPAIQQPSKIESPESTMIEPLSERELEVLRLFKTELSGPEIARELVIALSTVRTHTKSIFSKLNVNNRRAAVRRATELNLI